MTPATAQALIPEGISLKVSPVDHRQKIEALERQVDPTFQEFQQWEFEPGPDLPWLNEQAKFAKWNREVSESLWLSRWRMLLPLMRRKGITEIILFGHEKIEVETRDGIYTTSLNFDRDQRVPAGWKEAWHRPGPEDLAMGLNVIQRETVAREVWQKGRETQDVLIEAQLEDGSRIEALMPPCSTESMIVCNIRRFAPVKFSRYDFIGLGSFTERAADVMEMAVQAKATLLVGAETGAGKTTLLEYLLSTIPKHDFPLTIEDTPELQVDHPRHRGLKTRERMHGLDPNTVFQELYTADLLRVSLRLRPDWIIVGEIRDAGVQRSVADAFVNACQTGHAGAATIHADSPYGAMTRLESMLRAARPNMNDEALRVTLGDTVRFLIILKKMRATAFTADGVEKEVVLRRVLEIAECLGSDGHKYHLNPLFATRFREKEFVTALGVRTAMWPQLEQVGIPFFGLELEDKGYDMPEWWYESKLEFMERIPRVGIVAHRESLLTF